MKLPFETIILPGTEVLDALPGLRRDGIWPVVMGDPAELELLAEAPVRPSHPLYAAVDRLEGFSLEGWLENRKNEALAQAEEYGFDWPPRGPVAVAPSGSRFRAPSIQMGYDGQPLAQVLVGLPRIAAGWHFPTLIQYGGWNAYPLPLVHMALFRRWETAFGARLVSFSRDTIEMSVDRPPQSQADAEALAMVQYLYCPDLIDQGLGNLDTLAAALLAGHDWFFWWD